MDSNCERVIKVEEISVETASPKKFLSGSTIVLILLIASSVMTLLTVKKFLDVGMMVTPADAQVKKLTKLVNQNPKSNDARLHLAYSLQKTQRFEDAKIQYYEVLKSDPGNPGALYNLACIAWDSQEDEEAIRIFTLLLQEHPGHILGSVKLGNIYIGQGQYDEAIKVAEAAIRERPSTVEVHIVKAKALEAKGEYDKAVDEYQEVLRYVPDYKAALEAIDRIY